MADFEHKVLPWVYACGDTTQMIVWRSLAVDSSDQHLARVRDHISEHGLVLMERETFPSDDVLFGRVEKSWLVNAEARQLLLAFSKRGVTND